MTGQDTSSTLTSGSLRNIIFKVMSEVVAKPVVLIYTIILTRLLAPSDYGNFTVAITFAIFIGVISDVGLSTIMLREASVHEGKELKDLIDTIFTFKFLIIIPAIFLASVFILVGPIKFADNGVAIILVISLCFYWFLEVILTTFRARFKPEKEATLFILWRVILVVITLIMVYNFRSIISAAISHMATSILLFILGFIFVYKYISKIDLHISREILSRVLKSSVFIFLSSIFVIAYFRIDIILMNLFEVPPADIGRYGAVYKIIEAVMVFPAAIAGGVFPALSRVARYKVDDIQKAGELLRPVTFFGLLSPILLIPLTRYIILVAFGRPFICAFSTLNILLLALPFIFINYILFSLLISLGMERKNLVATVLCLIFNLVANIILIPKLGINGAAITTVLTELVLMVICALFLINRIRVNILVVITGFISGILIVGLELYMYNWWIAIPAIILFILISFIAGLIKTGDFNLLVKNIRGITNEK